MALRRYSPRSPGVRFKVGSNFSDITCSSPYKPLLSSIGKASGRSNHGRISMRYKGGGSKRLYRSVDFYRSFELSKGVVETIEYDPYRTARIALIKFNNGVRRYIIAPQGVSVGQMIENGKSADIKTGNCLCLKDIPVGSVIHNIELNPGEGGKFVRGAGTFAVFVGKDDPYCLIKLPSGETRKILGNCQATIGQVGNLDHENIVYGKAGAKRWRGIRPHVRGMAMNPIDHPLGGGEGRGKGHHPVTPWGQPCKGYKTRNTNRTEKFIVTRRKG